MVLFARDARAVVLGRRGRVWGAAQPCSVRAWPRSPRARRTVAGAYLPRPAVSHPESLSHAGALRPPRRPARALPLAVLPADRPRSAALGLGPGPGAVLPPAWGLALAWLLPGELLSSFSLKGPVREGKGLVQRLLGLSSGSRRSGPRLRRLD